MSNRIGGQGGHRLFEIGFCLLRHTAQEVDADVLEPRLEDAVQGSQCCFSRMHSPQTCE